MRILLNACVPRPLKQFLTKQTARTAQEMGWGQLKNGALLQEAQGQFDAPISTDQNLKYQQNMARRRLAILILPTNNWSIIRAQGESIAATVGRLGPGDFVELNWD